MVDSEPWNKQVIKNQHGLPALLKSHPNSVIINPSFMFAPVCEQLLYLVVFVCQFLFCIELITSVSHCWWIHVLVHKVVSSPLVSLVHGLFDLNSSTSLDLHLYL
jgi:hypothetical protein